VLDKTALLEATARQLRGMTGVAIVVANPAAQRDAERLTRYCDHVEVVNSAAPTAEEIHTAVQHLQLKGIQIVFIESLGGIFGVPDFGQDVTVAVLAVSGGDDKAAEYANLVSHSDVVILTKSELQRHVMFDRGVMRLDVHRINPIAEFLEVSAFENTGSQKVAQLAGSPTREERPLIRAIQAASATAGMVLWMKRTTATAAVATNIKSDEHHFLDRTFPYSRSAGFVSHRGSFSQ